MSVGVNHTTRPNVSSPRRAALMTRNAVVAVMHAASMLDMCSNAISLENTADQRGLATQSLTPAA
jgi:hypothetical protein